MLVLDGGSWVSMSTNRARSFPQAVHTLSSPLSRSAQPAIGRCHCQTQLPTRPQARRIRLHAASHLILSHCAF